MKFDSYITSNTKTASTVKDYTEFLNKYEFDKEKFSLKKAAFTLAETLITLTIIGVVAALTIPNLISSYQKHTYVVGLKKAYSQFQNAMKMIPITQGCPAGDFDCAGWNDWGHYENGQWVSDVTNIDGQEFNGKTFNKRTYLLSKQFKINKLCYSRSTDPECTKAAKASYGHWTFNAAPLFVTNDGMTFYYNSSLGIGIDINGLNGPNKYGRDLFQFYITDQYAENRYGIPQGTIVPYGSKLYADIRNQPNEYWRNGNHCTTENVNKGKYGVEYCAGRVLEEDAMNY